MAKVLGRGAQSCSCQSTQLSFTALGNPSCQVRPIL